jgi:hypothetical protein
MLGVSVNLTHPLLVDTSTSSTTRIWTSVTNGAADQTLPMPVKEVFVNVCGDEEIRASVDTILKQEVWVEEPLVINNT